MTNCNCGENPIRAAVYYDVETRTRENYGVNIESFTGINKKTNEKANSPHKDNSPSFI